MPTLQPPRHISTLRIVDYHRTLPNARSARRARDDDGQVCGKPWNSQIADQPRTRLYRNPIRNSVGFGYEKAHQSSHTTTSWFAYGEPVRSDVIGIRSADTLGLQSCPWCMTTDCA